MAKRRRSSGSNVATQAPIGYGASAHWDVGIRSAENGAVINISHQSEGKNPRYTSKTLVATSPRAALRIAAQHCPAMGKKARGKKSGKRKAFATKSV